MCIEKRKSNDKQAAEIIFEARKGSPEEELDESVIT